MCRLVRSRCLQSCPNQMSAAWQLPKSVSSRSPKEPNQRAIRRISLTGAPPAGEHGSVIDFLGVILVPRRDLYHDVGRAVGHGLAAEARLRRDAGSFV